MKILRKLWGILMLGVTSVTFATADQPAEKQLFMKTTEFSTVIVTQQGPYVILKFRGDAGDVEESRAEIDRPWLVVHEYLRLQLQAISMVPQLDDALVVGLGGGALSNQLAHAFPQARVDSLEIDPVVVEVAHQYFGYQEDDRHKAYVGDARAYLKNTNRLYDVIFLDAFDGLEIPDQLRTRQFYQLVKAHLKPSGAVVTNLHLRSKYYDNDRNTLQSVFANSYSFLAIAQAAVVCQDGPLRTKDWIIKRAEAVKAQYGLPYPLDRLPEQLEHQNDWNKSAMILNDPDFNPGTDKAHP